MNNLRMHCVICIVLYNVLFNSYLKGQMSWTLHDKPAVFGRMVKLICKLPRAVSCCNEFTRKWSKGWDNERIVMNSVSLNESKYGEHLNISTKTSILTIKHFSEGDINIPYECTYGFDTARKNLLLTLTDFECKCIRKSSASNYLIMKKSTGTIC